MKKIQYSFLMAMGLSLLILAGCGQIQIETPQLPWASASPSPTPAPTPTPTPVPTPIPYEQAAANSAPEYSFAANYAQVSEALSVLGQASEDPWTAHFTAAGVSEAVIPEVSCLGGLSGEGDIIAAGESCLYILDNKDLVILSLDGGDEAVLSRTTVGIDWTGGESDNGTNVSGYEKCPLAVYPFGDMIAVISDWYGYHGSAASVSYMEYTSVDFFRVTDPTAPVFLSSFGQDGIYQGSRLGSDGYLTIVTDFTPLHNDPGQPEGLVPHVYSGGSNTPLAADRVLLTKTLGELPESCAVLGSYSLSDPGQCDVIAVPGLAYEDISLMNDGPRFIRRRWAESPSRVLMEGETEITEYAVTACTDVYRLSMEAGALRVESVSVVNGTLLDAAAMDRQSDRIWYVSSLCQGLYTLDEQGGVFWKETVTGTRIACLDPLSGEGLALELPEDEAALTWVGFLRDSAVFTAEDGQSYLCLNSGTEVQPLTDPLSGGMILPWGESGYMAFYRADGDTLTLSVRDNQLREIASRRFGSDHSNTLESRRSYFTDEEANLLGFSADDSYCLYGFSESEGLYFRGDTFLKDWAWNARAVRIGDRLIVADTVEVFLYDAYTLELLASYEL